MVLPPSKRQKAQKPHSCAVFLLLKYLIIFEVQNTFLFEKSNSLFSKFFYARSNRLFRQSQKPADAGFCFAEIAAAKNVPQNCLIISFPPTRQ